jgi:hypothetical protein
MGLKTSFPFLQLLDQPIIKLEFKGIKITLSFMSKVQKQMMGSWGSSSNVSFNKESHEMVRGKRGGFAPPHPYSTRLLNSMAKYSHHLISQYHSKWHQKNKTYEALQFPSFPSSSTILV